MRGKKKNYPLKELDNPAKESTLKMMGDWIILDQETER